MNYDIFFPHLTEKNNVQSCSRWQGIFSVDFSEIQLCGNISLVKYQLIACESCVLIMLMCNFFFSLLPGIENVLQLFKFTSCVPWKLFCICFPLLTMTRTTASLSPDYNFHMLKAWSRTVLKTCQRLKGQKKWLWNFCSMCLYTFPLKEQQNTHTKNYYMSTVSDLNVAFSLQYATKIRNCSVQKYQDQDSF